MSQEVSSHSQLDDVPDDDVKQVTDSELHVSNAPIDESKVKEDDDDSVPTPQKHTFEEGETLPQIKEKGGSSIKVPNDASLFDLDNFFEGISTDDSLEGFNYEELYVPDDPIDQVVSFLNDYPEDDVLRIKDSDPKEEEIFPEKEEKGEPSEELNEENLAKRQRTK